MSDLETVFLDTQTLEQLAQHLKKAGIMEDAGGHSHNNHGDADLGAQAEKKSNHR